ncbi:MULTISPECIES: hypothetical protein [unclassified Roseofilum]|uniref:hypothetical protein n=1 Tax=unclassified Roseofilum TaxID=2620099 RepID=UPI001B117D51|nr:MULTISPECIES: hypothetical protein [unclassified Roseofilum]MBP0007467.1 hypothetical protein [Roseofilum sp. Belize Diploria]MBP0031745.1 hypothetical protein [Roseofilum sp. Belize BBD 4]
MSPHNTTVCCSQGATVNTKMRLWTVEGKGKAPFPFLPIARVPFESLIGQLENGKGTLEVMGFRG